MYKVYEAHMYKLLQHTKFYLVFANNISHSNFYNGILLKHLLTMYNTRKYDHYIINSRDFLICVQSSSDAKFLPVILAVLML